MSRRRVLGAGVPACAAARLGGRAEAQPARAVDPPDAALARLLEGNARYVSGKMNERDVSANRAARARGQAPFAAVLGCADSRVAPELAFDQPPGELFVVRVAGNFMTPDGLGSLEFGAAVLGTKVIMVLGHTSCGAVNATVAALQKGNDLPGHIGDLVRAMKPGIESVLKQPGDDLYHRALPCRRVVFPTFAAPVWLHRSRMPNRPPGRTSKRRRTAKQTHLRLLRLELLADAHSRSPWRTRNSFRMTRAARFERAVSCRLRALAMSKAALAAEDDKAAVAEAPCTKARARPPTI